MPAAVARGASGNVDQVPADGGAAGPGVNLRLAGSPLRKSSSPMTCSMSGRAVSSRHKLAPMNSCPDSIR